MDVYLLWHMRPLEGQEHLDPEMTFIETDDKLCGVYSTRARASSAQQRLVTQPGFSDHPEAFLIDRYDLDEVHWTQGFVTE
ncbi:conserved protein of unknown function [Modestobacter italicus]|uniref:DUF7336 domain-containing protein n=1 Tax=Modestobacter italicus (strain DSM 44449 / CECT 9708 / BC 501) TaxID=2732864 RepID=I4F3C6_MODI5|nr:hypothetical protein [Modestobacter marinus]CCH90139.1 conserved protein of unknown function [Modestobacter marinus]